MKPQILFIVDAPNWAHDYKTHHLQRELGDEFQIAKRYQSEVTAADIDQADLVVVYYWLQIDRLRHLENTFSNNRHKLLIGISGIIELQNQWLEPGLATLRSLARGVFAINMRLFQEMQTLLDVPVFYTPNGVDTTFYHPLPGKVMGTDLRVGWAGSLSNHGPKQRGFTDLIVPGVNSVSGLELVTAIREDVWRDPEEMLEFYNTLDLYICASRSEGTPNPCLEAAACGIPIVTARVGNMPELIRDGINGLFIERDIGDIVAKLTLLRDDPELRTRLGQANLVSIQAWDWKLQAENYRRMFREIIDRPVPILTTDTHIKHLLMEKAKVNLSCLPADFRERHRLPNLTIIVLSYGRFTQTLNTLRALNENVTVPFKLLLIDNGSGAVIQTQLRRSIEQYDYAELILLDENLGCPGGRDLGLKHVTTEYVMFLDNDIEILPGAVEHLLEILETQPHVTAAGMTLVFPNGQIHLGGADFWLENDVLNYSLFGFGHAFDDGSLDKSGNCGWLNGGSTMFRREIFDIETWDARMRAHYEDLEWCYRVRQNRTLTFYRCAEALGLHYHEPKSPTQDSPRELWKRTADFIETIAYFYQKHGKVIQNLFDFVPELGGPNEWSAKAAKLFLELVNARGIGWVLEKWNAHELDLLFTSSAKMTGELYYRQHELVALTAERQQAVESLSAQLTVQVQKVNSLVALIAERQRAVDSLAVQLAEKEQSLHRQNDILNAIYGSKWWQVGARLFPVYARIRSLGKSKRANG